jgi:hypothetical protein
MVVVLPNVIPKNLSHTAYSKYEQVLSKSETIYQYCESDPSMEFESLVIRPIKEKDTLVDMYTKDGNKSTKYRVFSDNPPQWNQRTNSYVYDFKGRVTLPSIKNF